MRVLSVATLFPGPGKAGNFGGFVARQFAALTHHGDIELTIINPQSVWTGPVAESAKYENSRSYPVHRPRYLSIPRIGARWTPALIARAVLPLARRLHAERPFDLVDAQFFWPDGPAAATVARALGLPLSIKARGSDIHYWGQKHFANRRMLAAAKQAGGLLAVSEALQADMVSMGMEATKVTVHYTGLDHEVFYPLPRLEEREGWKSYIPESGPLIVSVGNLIALKGHALAIEALAEIDGPRLAIAGSGEELPKLQTLVDQLALNDRVHFLGQCILTDLRDLLAAADVFVLPSEREGLANVWIEALACGTPLVITDVGGAREVVTSPAAGRLVERTPQAIAAAVRELLANPPARGEVAAHAARFSWEVNAAQLAAHYRRIIDQNT